MGGTILCRVFVLRSFRNILLYREQITCRCGAWLYHEDTRPITTGRGINNWLSLSHTFLGHDCAKVRTVNFGASAWWLFHK